jgi:hypothetical protein
MMAITTNSSIRVKPIRARDAAFLAFMVCGDIPSPSRASNQPQSRPSQNDAIGASPLPAEGEERPMNHAIVPAQPTRNRPTATTTHPPTTNQTGTRPLPNAAIAAHPWTKSRPPCMAPSQTGPSQADASNPTTAAPAPETARAALRLLATADHEGAMADTNNRPGRKIATVPMIAPGHPPARIPR